MDCKLCSSCKNTNDYARRVLSSYCTDFDIGILRRKYGTENVLYV